MGGAPRITLEQWRALQAVVDAGGYAQAAAALHKSQSTVTYAVQQIQKLLDVKVFEIHGRKAVLTDAGQVLYRRARTLLEEAAHLEHGAAVLAGTGELLSAGHVDIAIGSERGGVVGAPLLPVRFIAVAHPDHPLHRLGRPLTERDLKRHRRIFIRDTSTQRKSDTGGAELRWTVSHKATSIRAVSMGLAFAWLPAENIVRELAEGSLKPLPLKAGAERTAELFLAFSDPEFPGRDAARLGDIIRARCAAACRTHKRRVAARRMHKPRVAARR
jgi:DNA-binding transcriptional LysR family regulator